MTDVVAAIMATFDVADDEQKRTALEQSVMIVVAHIKDAGMVVVPVTPLLASDLADFEAVVLANLTPVDDATKASELDAADVNGESVIHALRSKGWLILPPK